MSKDRFGKTISSSLYRLSDALWLNEIRENIGNLVDYISNNDSFSISKDIKTEIFQKTVFGKTITSQYDLKKFKQAAISIARIKNEFPEIVNQLKTSGNRVHNIKSMQFIFFKHNERVWRIPEKNKEVKFQTTNSFVLFVPSMSRVLSFETPEEKLSFERFRFGTVKNVQLEEAFSKIKGNSWRKTIPEDKFAEFSNISFLFRTIKDAKIIHSGKRLENFSFVTTDDAGEKTFKIVFYFITLGRILEYTALPVSSNKPANMKKIKIVDSTGELSFETFEGIDHTNDLMSESIDNFFNLPKNHESLKFRKNNFVLTISRWGLGDSIPEILYLKNLGDVLFQSRIDNFYMLAYLNIRKKVNSELLRKMFNVKNLERCNSLYSKGIWTYHVNPEWDIKEFEITIRKDRSELDVLAKGPSQYLVINEFHHKLYISENPQKEFAVFYNLSPDNMCLKCGRELYKFEDFTIQSHIQNNAWNVSIEYQSLFSFNEDSMDVLNMIKSNLKEIDTTKNIKNAEIFVKQFFNDKRGVFGNKNDLDICKIVHDIFNSIKELKQRRMFFQFSKNPEIISVFLKLENPKMIHIGDPPVIDLSLGKNCIVHGQVVQKISEDRGKISFILESYAIKDFEQKKSEKFISISQNIKNYSTRWYNLVDDAIVNNKQISHQEIIEFKKQWIDVCNKLNEELFINSERIRLDLSPIKQLTIEENLFFIFCYIVQKNELHSLQNWKNILDKIYEYRRIQKSESARQTGNISDMNLLLRAIALRFYNFHYQNAIGNKEPFGSDVLYNSLRMQMERITFSDKKNSNRFTYLDSVSFQSHKFAMMCKRLLTGEIKDVKEADRFLGNYSWRDEDTKFKGMQQRKHFVNQKRVEPRQLVPYTSHSKTQNPTPKHFIRKEQTPLKDPVLENRLEKIDFQNGLEELSREWKRVSDAKSQTHAPKIYHESKNIFQPKLQSFINRHCKTCPEISSLRGKSIESKEIKNFFSALSQKTEFTQEAVAKMMGGA